MFKFLVLSVFLCQNIGVNSGLTADSLRPVQMKMDSSIPELIINGTTSKGVSNYIGSLQMFFNGPFYFNTPRDLNGETWTDENSNSNLQVNATYKLYSEQLSWNQARKACIYKGGHLAVMNSTEELDSVIQDMSAQGIKGTWIGVHNMFSMHDWISVLGESLDKEEWFQRLLKSLPDTVSIGQCEECYCGVLVDIGIMERLECNWQRPYLCKF